MEIEKTAETTSSVESDYKNDFGKNLGAMVLVILFAALGGFIVALFQGPTLCGRKLKKCCTTITIPHLVGMITFGCIARNAFGNLTVEYYPVIWADWMR